MFSLLYRICPGRYLALNSAWIAIASLLATFNLTKAIDEQGKEIEPVIDYSEGIVWCVALSHELKHAPD